MNKTNPHFLALMEKLNDGSVHDGVSLGKTLDLSRAAVWKLVKQLSQEGVPITSHHRKGYQLLTPIHLLEKEKIQKFLKNFQPQHLFDLEVYHFVDSTNDVVKASVQANANIDADINTSSTISFCLAEKQRKGRGRRQHAWFSPFGTNIYLSCAYPLQKDISEYSGLSLVVSLSVIKALKEAGINEPLQIKWPNDIVFQGKKLGGILIELNVQMHTQGTAVIGVGLNVNKPFEFQENLENFQNAISLEEICGKSFDRNHITAEIIKTLLQDLSHFDEKGFAPFLTEWENYDYLKGKAVTLYSGEQKMVGEAKGITEFGYLKLQAKSGTLQTFSAGEVTLSQDK